jgi:ribosomal protein S18 acetylase RimI-like enzyme
MGAFVRHALRRDADAVIDALIEAFAEDPVWCWTFSHPATRPEHLRTFMTAAFERSFACGHAFLTADGHGVALWCPADVEFFDDTLRSALVAAVVASEGDRTELVFEGLRALGALHPEETHVYLHALGVVPAARSRGLGAALLDHVLAVCTAEGVPAYLESSNARNVSLYERHGFAVMAEVALPEAGPVVRPMWRPR